MTGITLGIVNPPFEEQCTGTITFTVDNRRLYNFEQGREGLNSRTERDLNVVTLPANSGNSIAKLSVWRMAGTDSKLQSDWCFAHRPIPILILSRKLGSSQQRSKRSTAGEGVQWDCFSTIHLFEFAKLILFGTWPLLHVTRRFSSLN